MSSPPPSSSPSDPSSPSSASDFQQQQHKQSLFFVARGNKVFQSTDKEEGAYIEYSGKFEFFSDRTYEHATNVETSDNDQKFFRDHKVTREGNWSAINEDGKLLVVLEGQSIELHSIKEFKRTEFGEVPAYYEEASDNTSFGNNNNNHYQQQQQQQAVVDPTMTNNTSNSATSASNEDFGRSASNNNNNDTKTQMTKRELSSGVVSKPSGDDEEKTVQCVPEKLILEVMPMVTNGAIVSFDGTTLLKKNSAGMSFSNSQNGCLQEEDLVWSRGDNCKFRGDITAFLTAVRNATHDKQK